MWVQSQAAMTDREGDFAPSMLGPRYALIAICRLSISLSRKIDRLFSVSGCTSPIATWRRDRMPKIGVWRGAAAIAALISAPGAALKYAAREHNIAADPTLPIWHPGPVDVHPEEELNIIGADVMDEMTLGWVKMMRKAYPLLSVTMEARASGSRGPALTAGTAHLAPVGRELLPAEEAAFVAKYGYEPTAFRVATGSAGSLGKTAASIILVDKDN